MPDFEQDLLLRLRRDEEENLTRTLQVLPAGVTAFSSNDYLGLAGHPRILQAARTTLEKSGAVLGATAARLINGQHPGHSALENTLARFKNTQASLSFPSGYAAATGTIPALLDKSGYAVFDKLSHACLIDGARLSGAALRVFPHNDLDHLRSILQEIRRKDAEGRILILVESLYSMDGDLAPLAELCRLKSEFGAWLMVDEAHATGVCGPGGAGLCREAGIDSQVEVQMGTLGKALGVSGGYIAGSNALIQILLQHARAFIFTTGTPPCLAEALVAALEIVQSPEGENLRVKLRENLRHFHAATGHRWTSPGPIIPIPAGSEARALLWSETLRQNNLHVPAVRYPTVAHGAARLRVTLNSLHTTSQIDALARTLLSISPP